MRWQKQGLFALTAFVSVFGMSACGGQTSDFCKGISSVADFVNRFSLGLDNFPENEYSQLRLEALDTYDVVMEAVRESDDSFDAVRLSRTLSKFITEMDKVEWDVTRALQETSAIAAATELGSAQSLVRANSVESFVISECGLPSTLPINSPVDTLPLPSIPAPTETEPPTDTINQDSEYFSTGMLLGSIYGIELSQFEATCLGRKLDGVVDVTGDSAFTDTFLTQVQQAFDSCEIPFSVPRD